MNEIAFYFVALLWGPSFFLSYLAGSIPFGLILTKLAGYGDIRKIGSGNIGATNVLRSGNKFLALATLLLDGGKGAVVVLIIQYFFPFFPIYFLLVCSFGVILGHMFPVWLKFKGGKGVATTLGVLLAAVPWAGLTACGTWLFVGFLFRYSSLAALVAMLAGSGAAFFIYGPAPGVIAFIIVALVWWKHRENIRRLLKGEEPKIGQKKAAEG